MIFAAVIEDDKHHRFAAYGETIGFDNKKCPDAESVEQINADLLLAFSERLN